MTLVNVKIICTWPLTAFCNLSWRRVTTHGLSAPRVTIKCNRTIVEDDAADTCASLVDDPILAQMQCSSDVEDKNERDTTEKVPKLVSETRAQDHLSKMLLFFEQQCDAGGAVAPLTWCSDIYNFHPAHFVWFIEVIGTLWWYFIYCSLGKIKGFQKGFCSTGFLLDSLTQKFVTQTLSPGTKLPGYPDNWDMTVFQMKYVPFVFTMTSSSTSTDSIILVHVPCQAPSLVLYLINWNNSDLALSDQVALSCPSKALRLELLPPPEKRRFAEITVVASLILPFPAFSNYSCRLIVRTPIIQDVQSVGQTVCFIGSLIELMHSYFRYFASFPGVDAEYFVPILV